MQYRLYVPADFPQLYGIEQVCFQPPFRFPRRYMLELVSSSESATWIAEEEQTMAGFGIVEWNGGSEQISAYIQTLEVAPVYRKRGIATELLRRLEVSATAAGARAIGLHVAETNASAINLYQANGYDLRGREEDYYGEGIAALIHSKGLAQPGQSRP